MESENILAALYGGHIVVNPLLVAKEKSREPREGQAHIVRVFN